MIIPYKPSQHSQDEYIICPRSPLTVAELRDRMLHRAKVIEGSYAYWLVDNLHAAIFLRSLDLKADYHEYFVREYDSFDEYLRRRVRLPSDVVTMLALTVDESSGVFHFTRPYEFLDDAYGLEFLTRLIENSPPGEAS